MIKFSEKRQAFYDFNYSYADLPDDLVNVPDEDTHMALYAKINDGCHVFANLTVSDPRPTAYHVWSGGGWYDTDTPEKQHQRYLGTLKPLTRRQFILVLVKHNLDDLVDAKIEAIEDVLTRKTLRVEYKESNTFIRTSSSIINLTQLLNLTEEQVNSMWEEAMAL